MTVFERGSADEPTYLDGPPSGFGWIAHPNESGRRSSHAFVGPDGVWLVDPLDADGVDERIRETGAVAGVVACSNYHARDAERFARRYGVPVTVPPWLDRVAGQIDTRVRRTRTVADDSIRFHRLGPIPGWTEALAVADDTVYVADALARRSAVGEEVVGLVLPFRLRPPRAAFAATTPADATDARTENATDARTEFPARLLTGHGRGVHDNAAEALSLALTAPWRRLPRALVDHGPEFVRGVTRAAID